MICLQIIPKSGIDAYSLLRDKVTYDARTWSWKNKAKTRLTHNNGKGYIEVASADGVLVAEIHPTNDTDSWFFIEKFVGRLVAWFPASIVAINIQLREAAAVKKKKR